MTSTGRSSTTGNGTTFDGSAAIVRRLFRDRHVVRMGLAKPRYGDADEPRVLHLVDRRRTAIAHRLAQPTDQLVQHRRQRALVRHATLDALGDELFDVFDVALAVPVFRVRAPTRRPHRTDSPVRLVPL